MVPLDRRALHFTKPSPLVEIARIERSLKPNRAFVFPARQVHCVPQNRSADALENVRTIDIDGNHGPCRRLAKTDNTAVPLSYEERASFNGTEIPTGTRFNSQASMTSAE